MKNSITPKITYNPNQDEGMIQLKKYSKHLVFGNFVIYSNKDNELCAMKILKFSEEVKNTRRKKSTKLYENPLLKIAGLVEIGPMTSKEIDKEVYKL